MNTITRQQRIGKVLTAASATFFIGVSAWVMLDLACSPENAYPISQSICSVPKTAPGGQNAAPLQNSLSSTPRKVPPGAIRTEPVKLGILLRTPWDNCLDGFPATLEEMAAGILARRRYLLDAILRVEGWGGVDTVGLAGERGPYQVTPDWWIDANEANKTNYPFTPEFYLDKEVCEDLILAYWQRYGANTDEERARMHNGGPKGPAREPTLEYWRRVKLLLDAWHDERWRACK